MELKTNLKSPKRIWEKSCDLEKKASPKTTIRGQKQH